MVSKKSAQVDEALHTLKKFKNIRENLEILRSQMKSAGDVDAQIREAKLSIAEIQEFQEKMKQQVANVVKGPQEKLIDNQNKEVQQKRVAVDPLSELAALAAKQSKTVNEPMIKSAVDPLSELATLAAKQSKTAHETMLKVAGPQNASSVDVAMKE